MRVSVLSGFLAITTVAASAAEITPEDPKKPLFRIFAPVPMTAPAGAPPADVTFDDKKPLLVVRSVSDLLLARDKKGVLLTLTPADAKKFAAITREHTGRLLLLEADGEVLQAMRITAPIVDGIIGFKHPEERAVAEYLRRRFRIAEFQ